MAIVDRKVENIWASLSDAWGKFEDKPTIEGLWSGIAAGADLLLNKTMEVQNSRIIDYLPPIIEDGPQTFVIIESGTGSNVVPSGVDTFDSGLFKMYIDDWTLSIPTLVQSYYVVGSGVTHTYTEGVDYTISGMNTLIWITTPEWDLRYPGRHVLTLTADSVKRINPVLMNLWARFLDLELDDFNQYNIFQTATDVNKYKHLKYFVWALFSKRLHSPTVKNIEDAVNIAYGFPFAYEAGTAQVVASGLSYNITIGDQTYYLPASLTPCIADGAVVERFDLLARGITVYDYYNNPSVEDAQANVLTKYNTLVLQKTTALGNLVTNSPTFYQNYRSSMLPIHFFIKDTTV